MEWMDFGTPNIQMKVEVTVAATLKCLCKVDSNVIHQQMHHTVTSGVNVLEHYVEGYTIHHITICTEY